MTETAIRVENLSKLYRIGAKQEAYKTLRDTLAGAVTAPLRRLSQTFKRSNVQTAERADGFWALKDVSFEVKRGEVVGIIGRNGAGKSTLLKILSRITEPTSGYADIYGRVGSLLEVGTGFHAELTGRENIFLNGAILGMKRAEIARQFDAIVEFAEVERFVDTPVKHYSSGMYLRLAFAVAAHLEPEILLVDEVLAVGDAEFQKKCLGKMQDIGLHGRTVFFVSHSMPAIQKLCSRILLVEQGKIVVDGDPTYAISQYLRIDRGGQAEMIWPTIEQAPGDNTARLRAVRVRDQSGELISTVDIREPIFIEVEYWNLQSRLRPTISIHLINQEGICLFTSNDYNNKTWWNTPRLPSIVCSTCIIPGNFLAEGNFNVLAAVCTYNPNIVHAIEHDIISFQVVDPGQGDSVRGEFNGSWPGVVRPMLDWEAKVLQSI